MRQFLAVDLSDELRAGLGSLQKRLQAEARGWRWVRPEKIHLTLRFLGEVPIMAEESFAHEKLLAEEPESWVPSENLRRWLLIGAGAFSSQSACPGPVAGSISLGSKSRRDSRLPMPWTSSASFLDS